MNEAHRQAKRQRHVRRILEKITEQKQLIYKAKNNPLFVDKAFIGERQREIGKLRKSLAAIQDTASIAASA